MKRLTALAVMTVILFVAVSAIASAGRFPTLSANSVYDGSFAKAAETLFAENVPKSGELASLAFRLKYISGRRESGGIIIGDDGSLIKAVAAPENGTVEAAVNAIQKFVENHSQRTSLMLVPTAAMIKQQEIPQYLADGLYNQRHLITETYGTLSGKVTTVDVYQNLFNHRDEYIYYNTEENLTALGGYYVYEEICSRLGFRVRGTSSFDIDYGSHGFYGGLAEGVLRDYAEPDVVSMYVYSQYERNYTVIHTYEDGTQTTHKGIYYTAGEVGTDKTDMVFGGLSPVMDIEIDGPYDEWLLVFGDKTVKAWLPFLTNHYAHVTFVELSAVKPAQLSALDVTDYQHVLFGYGADTFMAGVGLENLVFIG